MSKNISSLFKIIVAQDFIPVLFQRHKEKKKKDTDLVNNMYSTNVKTQCMGALEYNKLSNSTSGSSLWARPGILNSTSTRIKNCSSLFYFDLYCNYIKLR